MLLIRPAAPSDVPLLLRCFRELAEYQRQPHAVVVEELSRYGRQATREGAPSPVNDKMRVFSQPVKRDSRKTDGLTLSL